MVLIVGISSLMNFLFLSSMGLVLLRFIMLVRMLWLVVGNGLDVVIVDGV